LRLHLVPLEHSREQRQCDGCNGLDHLQLQELADFFEFAFFRPSADGCLLGIMDWELTDRYQGARVARFDAL
jgi:hypothetical protein